MLTKSAFRKFVECKNEFWLDTHLPERREQFSINELHGREMGYEVERLARSLRRFADLEGYKTEFGKVFETDSLYAKADIVITEPATGEIEIYEVKSGASAKKEYLDDLAFQRHVAKSAGYIVKKVFLVTVDTSYVLDGNPDAEQLLRVTDQTDAVELIEASIAEQIEAALTCLLADEPPATLVDYCKTNKLDCRFLVRKFPNIPTYNVSHIFNAGSKKLNELLLRSILKVCNIPPDFELTELEERIVAVARSGKPEIDAATIRGELDGLKYPLNFLDYETFSYAVPKFTGTSAYQQLPFQYSLHTMDEPGGEVRHSYHLSRNDGRHPAQEVVGHLYEDLGRRIGTVIVWSEGFEISRNKELGRMYPQYAEFLSEINDHIYDLRKIFSRRLYMHPEFHGRDSIKKVLPVLCPELSYEEMKIADGVTASIKWYHMATARGSQEEREQIYQNLLGYCKLDTLAMVEIYKTLKRL